MNPPHLGVHPFNVLPLGANAQLAAQHYADASGYDEAARPGGRICYQLPERTLGLLRPLLYQSDRVLDLGCGSGLVGRALLASGHTICLTGVDCSPQMLDMAHAAGYKNLFLGDIPQVVKDPLGTGRSYEWAVAIGSPYYLTPNELSRTLHLLMAMCRKGICLSLERLAPEFIQAVDEKLQGKGPMIYDHSRFFETFRVNPDWKLTLEPKDHPAWISPSTGIQVTAKLALLQRNRFPHSI